MPTARARDFFKMPVRYLNDGTLVALSHPALKLFLILANLADNATGQAYPSWSYLSANTGMCRRSVATGMAELHRKKLVIRLAEAIPNVATAVYEVHNCVRPTVPERISYQQMSFGWGGGGVQDSAPETPDIGARFCTQNKNQLFTKTTSDGLTPDQAVVVKRVVRDSGMHEDPARRLVAKYGITAVKEGLKLLGATPRVRRKAAFLIAAVRDEYLPETPTMPASRGIRGRKDSERTQSRFNASEVSERVKAQEALQLFTSSQGRLVGAGAESASEFKVRYPKTLGGGDS